MPYDPQRFAEGIETFLGRSGAVTGVTTLSAGAEHLRGWLPISRDA
jgi:hypothetical protein